MTAVSAEENSLSSKRSWKLKAELSSICLNAGGAETALGSIKADQLAAPRSQNIPSPRRFHGAVFCFGGLALVVQQFVLRGPTAAHLACLASPDSIIGVANSSWDLVPFG